jgi:hypothetical protein
MVNAQQSLWYFLKGMITYMYMILLLSLRCSHMYTMFTEYTGLPVLPVSESVKTSQSYQWT